MLRILLLSDMHFIHCEDDDNCYRSLETAFVEAMDEVRDSGGVNQILICGDVANKGQESEYQTAEAFLKRIFEHLGCDEKQTQVYVVPGNHDIDRNINKMTRWGLRSSLSDINQAEEFMHEAKNNEMDTLKILYSPFKAFHKFANAHSSLDGIAEAIFLNAPNFMCRSFRKEVELGILNDYIIKLHCLNSALLCDKDDVYDPRDMKEGEHKLFIPKAAYNPDTPSTTVNISMMHHPHAWFINEEDLRAEFDRKFKIQIYGHIHTQSISQDITGKSAIRLQVGSLHPGQGSNPDLYPPLYNILEIDIVREILTVKVMCYSWDGYRFNKNDRFSYQKKIKLEARSKRTTKQKDMVNKMKMTIENSDEVYELKYRLYKSEHIKEIISEIKPKAYDDNKEEEINAMIFFQSIALKKDMLEQLRVSLTKYGD